METNETLIVFFFPLDILNHSETMISQQTLPQFSTSYKCCTENLQSMPAAHPSSHPCLLQALAFLLYLLPSSSSMNLRIWVCLDADSLLLCYSESQRRDFPIKLEHVQLCFQMCHISLDTSISHKTCSQPPTYICE
jgi:hypothetical protein